MAVKRFVTTFIICAMIIIAVIAMIRADLYTRELSGDYNRSIFSYEKITPYQGRLEVFGVVYSIDLDYVDKIKEKISQIYTHNLNYIPDFMLNCADIFSEAIIKTINSLQIKSNML